MTKEKYPPPRVWLNIKICEAIYKAYKDLAPQAGVGEPVPDFDRRYPNTLEGIIGSVQYKADTLSFDLKKTVIYYFVHLTKSQCFLDANKRLAVVITSTFLRLNGYQLAVFPSRLRDLAILIAKNQSLSVEMAAKEIDRFFQIIKIP